MRTTLISAGLGLVLLALPATALADERVDWTSTAPESGTVVNGDVEVRGPGTFRLITLNDPSISGDSYVVRGEVRYAEVDGLAYVEMWSHFADGGAYFSRTLDDEGAMAALQGDSSGRSFELPFFLGTAQPPVRIEINVVLPEGGTVWVGPLTLQPLGSQEEWWSEGTGALIGGLGGAFAGLLGAGIGILGGRRKARRTVLTLLTGGLAAGVAALVAGGAALLASQPRHVWYPLVLLGLILGLVDGALLPVARRAYAAAELQRIKALDLR